MVIKIVYQNMGKGNKAQHAWLENCRKKEVDIMFVGEVFIDNRRDETINMTGYKLVAELRVTSKVAAY